MRANDKMSNYGLAKSSTKNCKRERRGGAKTLRKVRKNGVDPRKNHGKVAKVAVWHAESCRFAPPKLLFGDAKLIVSRRQTTTFAIQENMEFRTTDVKRCRSANCTTCSTFAYLRQNILRSQKRAVFSSWPSSVFCHSATIVKQKPDISYTSTYTLLATTTTATTYHRTNGLARCRGAWAPPELIAVPAARSGQAHRWRWGRRTDLARRA